MSTESQPLQSLAPRLTGAIPALARLVWRELSLLILLGAMSFGFALAVEYLLGYPLPTFYPISWRNRWIFQYAVMLGPFALALGLLRRRWTLRRATEAVTVWNDTLAGRIVLAVATLLLMMALFSVFAIWKAGIPSLNPWRWDVTLVGIERAVHAGMLPQDVTRHLFGLRATVVLDRSYVLWFHVLSLFVVWQSFRAPSASRTRALLAMALAYTLLGNVGAVLLSSGGPPYYDELVGGPNPYQAHAAYLAAIPGLYATEMQESIWRWLQTGIYVPFGSISAMPSMHVAAATVMALACWERDRRLGVAGWLYVLLILLGSVHLNWHYAIDGYVSILGALAVWPLSAWLVRRYRPADPGGIR